MSLKTEDKTTLSNAGFLPYEIKIFDTAKAPDGTSQPVIDLRSPVWQRTIQSRREWTDDKEHRGWTQDEIEGAIMAYYQRHPKADPFAFLKAEYKPPAKRDFWDNVRAREQQKIQGTLKGYRFK